MSVPHPRHSGHPDMIHAQPRPRAYSTLPSFPHGPPDYIAPKFANKMDKLPPIPPPIPFANSPLRLQQSNYSAGSISMNPDQAQAHFHPQLPQIRCPTTLLAAVQNNPEHIFTRLLSLIDERDALKRDLISLNEDFAHARKDWKCAREKYEELVDIGLAKQVVLWKFIERLRSGEGVGSSDWKVDEMRCKRGMSETSELSEGSSEGGGWSLVGEGRGLGLDPNAQSFTPRFGSPPKYYEEPSNCSPPRQPTPPAISLTHPSRSPSHSPSNLTNRLSDLSLKSLIATLPPRFYGICPHSLTSSTPCPLPKCNLQQLCRDYNNESNSNSSAPPNSNSNSNGCTNASCPYVHEYRTCEDEANGLICRFMRDGGGVGHGSWKKRKVHGCKRVHERALGGCGRGEWDIRCLVSSLRGEHREGRY